MHLVHQLLHRRAAVVASDVVVQVLPDTLDPIVVWAVRRQKVQLQLLPRGLAMPHGRQRQPFGYRPKMIGQSGCHCGTAAHPTPLLIFDPEGPNGPAEIVREHRQVCYCFVIPPILAESIRLASFSSVAVPVRAVLPFNK